MKRLLTLTATLLLFITSSQAQKEPYFQQEVNYKIDVQLDDKAHMLRGFESFEYINNSPDVLNEIYIHIWPNAYKNNKTALAKQLMKSGNTIMHYASEKELGYIDSLAFQVDGVPVDYAYDGENSDICVLQFPKPLKPGESVTITTPFKVKLPSGRISRMGHIGESYQITQWYPKPAVYDREGWHAMPYLNQGEFFSEFGSYEVSITLPQNYVVGATGDLQTPSEIEWLDEKIKEDTLWIAERRKAKDWSSFNDMSFPKSAEIFKTITYKQSRVHDFAWFADKRYKVLKGSVELPASKRKVDLYTMFTPRSASLWSKSLEYMHDAVYYYSLWNGDYPYEQATAVDGTISAGGGMEYPNVTVIGSTGSVLSLEKVIMHEVGHNWFYGILGSNERRFAWMDEGLNSYNEQRYMQTKYPNNPLLLEEGNPLNKILGLDLYGLKDEHFFTYLIAARDNMDQPLDEHSARYSNLNYGAIVYAKSAVFFNYLRHTLGDEAMDSAMHHYFNTYKFKHPYPEDYQRVMEESTGEDLSWFFEDVIESSKELDFRLSAAKTKNGATKVKVCNLTGIKGPVSVGFISKKGDTNLVWIPGFNHDTTFSIQGEYDRVEIDPNWIMPEVNRQNNYARTHGLFKKVEPLSLRLAGSAENPRKSTLYMLPAIGWNSPSGFMVGALAYNSMFPVKRFSYHMALMYGTRSNSPTGALKLNYVIPTSKSFIETIHLGAKGKSYAYYYTGESDNLVQYARAEPYIRFFFRPADYSSMWRHEVTMSSVITTALLRTSGEYEQLGDYNLFNRLNYAVSYAHPLMQSNGNVRFEQHEDFARLNASWTTDFQIVKKLNFTARVFGGTFLYNNSSLSAYNYSMDGQSASGQADYAFDAELLARDGKTFFDQQLTNTYGGFKVFTPLGQSDEYLTAANFSLTFGKFPVGLFGDIGHSSSEDFLYDAGVYLKITDVLKVYLPVSYSKEITGNNDLLQEIRFEFDLNKINVFDKIQRLKF